MSRKRKVVEEGTASSSPVDGEKQPVPADGARTDPDHSQLGDDRLDSQGTVRSKLRTLVRRKLRQHGYPPDKTEKAVDTVLRQAELLAANWAA